MSVCRYRIFTTSKNNLSLLWMLERRRDVYKIRLNKNVNAKKNGQLMKSTRRVFKRMNEAEWTTTQKKQNNNLRAHVHAIQQTIDRKNIYWTDEVSNESLLPLLHISLPWLFSFVRLFLLNQNDKITRDIYICLAKIGKGWRFSVFLNASCYIYWWWNSRRR